MTRSTALPTTVVAAAATIVILSLVACFPTLVAAVGSPLPGSWNQPSSRPAGKMKHAAACVLSKTGAGPSVLFVSGMEGQLMSAATNEWRLDDGQFLAGEPLLPSARAAMSVFTTPTGDATYSIGGFADNEQMQPTSTVSVLTQGHWIELTAVSGFAPRLHSFTSFSVGSLLYVSHGLSASGLADHNVTYIFNASVLGEESWTRITPSGIVPTPRFGMCCANISDGALCFSGTTNRAESAELYKYSVVTNQWQLLEPTGARPAARRYASCSVADNKFFIFGGEEGSGVTVPDNKLYSVDVAGTAWSSHSQPSSVGPVAGGTLITCVASNSTTITVLFGGRKGPDQTDERLMILNTATMTFSAFGETALVPSTVFHTAIVSGTSLYILGGLKTASALTSSDSAFRYVMDKSGVSGLPALSGFLRIEFSSGETSRLLARFGAVIAGNGGNLAFIHGGFDANGAPLDSLVRLDFANERTITVVSAWTVASDESPSARGLHSAFYSQGSLVVFGGSTSASSRFNAVDGSILDDVFCYSLISQQWARATIAGDSSLPTKLLPKRYGAISTSVNETHSLVGLGANDESMLLDFYICSLKEEGSTTVVCSTVLFFQNPTTEEIRTYARVSAAAVVVGSNAIVCGGKTAVLGIFMAPTSLACYKLHITTGTFVAIAPGSQRSETNRVGHTLVHFGNQLFMVGGHPAAPAERAMSVSTISRVFSIFEFEESALCTTAGSEACFPCSAGTLKKEDGARGCASAGKGSFVTDSGAKVRTCTPGQFANRSGMRSGTACAPCDWMTRSTSFGSTSCTPCDPLTEICPIGSQKALSRTDPAALLIGRAPSIRASHPPRFAQPTVAVVPLVLLCFFVALIVGILVVVLLMGRYEWQARVSEFFSERDLAEIKQLHDEFAKSGQYGMSERDWIRMLVSGSNGNELARKFFPTFGTSAGNKRSVTDSHGFTFSDADAIYKVADSYRNEMDVAALETAAILVIVRGFVPPRPGSQAAERFATHGNFFGDGDQDDAQIKKLLNIEDAAMSIRSRRLRLVDLDSYQESHRRSQVGKPQIVQKTNYGGVLRIVVSVLALVIVVVVVYDSIIHALQETLAVVPRSTISADFSPDGENLNFAEIDAHFHLTVRLAGVSRTRPGITSFADACVKSGSTNGTCASAAVKTTNVRQYRGLSSSSAAYAAAASRLDVIQTCNYITATGICEIKWSCLHCSVPDAGQALLSVAVSPAISAHYVEVELQTGTGISNPTTHASGQVDVVGSGELMSSVSHSFGPTLNETVLSGFPSSRVYVSLTPTFFYTDILSRIVTSSAEPIRESGFSVRSGGDVKLGQTATPGQFHSLFDVPIVVQLTVDATPILVKRRVVTTIVDLLAQIAGSLSGLIGAAIITLHLLDSLLQSPTHEPEQVKLPSKKNISSSASVLRAARKFLNGLRRAQERRRRAEKDVALTPPSNVNPLCRPAGGDEESAAQIVVMMDDAQTTPVAIAVAPPPLNGKRGTAARRASQHDNNPQQQPTAKPTTGTVVTEVKTRSLLVMLDAGLSLSASQAILDAIDQPSFAKKH